MELLWNNPNPNRTLHRPPVWQVIRRDGTRRSISDHEVQAIAEREVDPSANDALSPLQARVPLFYCF
jgi:hypothetical protein